MKLSKMCIHRGRINTQIATKNVIMTVFFQKLKKLPPPQLKKTSCVAIWINIQFWPISAFHNHLTFPLLQHYFFTMW